MDLTEVESNYGTFQIIQMKENSFEGSDLFVLFCIAKHQNYDRYEAKRI